MSDIKYYSAAIVFTKQEINGYKTHNYTDVRHGVVSAVSEAEALGKFILAHKPVDNGYAMANKHVFELIGYTYTEAEPEPELEEQ